MKQAQRHLSLLVCIAIFGGLLRLAWSDTQSLWMDEAFTLVNGYWPLTQMLLEPTDETPFLYYSLHRLFLTSDVSLVALRSISLAAGVASLLAIYVLGRLLFGSAAGLLCAALLAVWSAHIDYSIEARAYSLLMLLSLLTSIGVALYARALDAASANSGPAPERPRWIALAIFGAANVLAFYTHLTAVLWIAASSTLVLSRLPRLCIRFRRELYLTFSLMALAALPGIYRLVRQLSMGHDFYWLRQTDLTQFLAICAELMLPRGFWHNVLGLDLLWLFLPLTFLISLWWWFGRVTIDGASRTGGSATHLAFVRRGLLWAYLLMPAVVWLLGFVAVPLFMLRTVLFCTTGMILLLSAMCLRAEGSLRSGLAITLVSLYLASSLLFGVVREKEDWRGVSAQIASAADEGDVVLLCMPAGFAPIRYHWRKTSGPLVLGIQPTRTAASKLEGRIVELEPQLGTNQDWANTFRLAFLVTELEVRLGRHLPGSGPQVLRHTHVLRPGSVLLRIDNRCTGLHKLLSDALVAGISGRSTLIWRDAAPSPIEIRRYVVETESALSTVRYLVQTQ